MSDYKEYLVPDNGGYRLAVQDAGLPIAEDWIVIPEGSQFAVLNGKGEIDFYNGIGLEKNHFIPGAVIWQRATHPEELPFIDDNPQSLNDQYAEIERVRQAIKVKSGSDSDHALDAMSFGIMGVGLKDNVNHPSHYNQGKVECIEALESATIGKSGIEAVCVANVIKYLWRYEEKNGVEDVKKAQFYLNRLLATLEDNNG